MTDRPIIFSGPMVRALLEGRKIQTRRVIKLGRHLPGYCGPKGAENDPTCWGWEDTENGDWITLEKDPGQRLGWRDLRAAYRAGDRLWVKEAHNIWNAHGLHRDDGKRWGPWGGLPTQLSPDRTRIAYFREGFDRCDPGPWRSSRFMPRWASRLTLTVTDVRVQRVQEITDADAVAEGVQGRAGADIDIDGFWWPGSPVALFRTLWDSLNAKRGLGWEANPWVAALTFEVHRSNIDQMPES
ncbi:hypothetical protein [Albimonas pacifica]|uniref:Uncharacterized protein n=1 Tax=Albimonas pacifica TaxID=1114924 RepID=A0A1I3HKP1_9RHOB|nr:hypothetical protein [Albimonas pacifica]SFI36241.1 hypothetical protein SAMN05216258_10648 [Albimonas pacifica]